MRKNQRHQFVKPLKFYEHCINADLLCTCYVPGTSLVSGDRTPTETQPLPLGVRKTDVTIRICKGFPLALSPPLIHGPAIFFSVKGKIVNILAMRALVSITTPKLCCYWMKDPRTECKQEVWPDSTCCLLSWLAAAVRKPTFPPSQSTKNSSFIFFFLSFL